MAYQLSLAFLTLFDCDPIETITSAREAGFTMVGLRLLPAAPTEPPYPIMHDKAFRKKVAETLKATGIGVGDVEIARLKAETEVRSFIPFLENAAELGARHVLVAGDDPDEARLSATFAAFCQLCRQYRLTADLEFMPWTKVPNISTARRIVEAASEENGGIIVDALHFDRSDSSLAEVSALPRSLVNYAQLCDGPSEYDRSNDGLIRVARAERLFPGDGGIDCVALLRALPKGITLSIEVPNHALARQLTPKERARRAYQSAMKVIAATEATV